MSSRDQITVQEDGTVIAEGPNATRAYAMIAARRFMILEIKTGIKYRSGVNLFQQCRDQGISDKRSKKGVLNDLEAWMITHNMPVEITEW